MGSLKDLDAYAKDVLSNKISACKFIHQACDRYLSDKKREKTKEFPYRFDEAKATRALKACQLFPHVKGIKAGTPMVYEPWQVFIVSNLFGWVSKETGYRRFNQVYLEIPRGNGKSAMTSPLALYAFAMLEDAGAEVYSASTTKETAKIIFETSKLMAEKSKAFLDRFGVVVRSHDLLVPSSGSKFSVLSSEKKGLDGRIVSLAVLDEVHLMPNREVYDAMIQGCAKRPESILFMITTAGSDTSGIAYEQRDYLTKVLGGSIVDETFFGMVYTINEGMKWNTEEALRMANPNFGVSVNIEVTLSQMRKAEQISSQQNSFKTKHLGVWATADASFINMEKYKSCIDEEVSIEDFLGCDCYIGLDLAHKHDIAAKVIVFPRNKDGKMHYYMFEKYYLPSETVESSPNASYKGWVIDGYIDATSERIIDYDYIRDDLLEDHERFNIREVGFDPYSATQFSRELEELGLPMIQVNQNVATLSEPMKEVEAFIINGDITFTGNKCTEWQYSNVTVKPDRNDNIYPRKQKPENKIDGFVATVISFTQVLFHQEEEPEPVSNYSSRGFLFLD